PTQASVILFAKQGSDVLASRAKVKGIQHLVMRSVEGLLEENITIVNGDTNEEINDFEGLDELEKTSITDKQQKLIRKLESEYSASVLKSLQNTYGVKRVKIANMKITWTWLKNLPQPKSITESNSRMTIRPHLMTTVRLFRALSFRKRPWTKRLPEQDSILRDPLESRDRIPRCTAICPMSLQRPPRMVLREIMLSTRSILRLKRLRALTV
ncbi:MAG: hypothetical protein II054_09790, partial [Treponema sp.]|nr:hypothetical protein [Treponema sp.]